MMPSNYAQLISILGSSIATSDDNVLAPCDAHALHLTSLWLQGKISLDFLTDNMVESGLLPGDIFHAVHTLGRHWLNRAKLWAASISAATIWLYLAIRIARILCS